MSAAVPDPRFRDQLAEAARGHYPGNSTSYHRAHDQMLPSLACTCGTDLGFLMDLPDPALAARLHLVDLLMPTIAVEVEARVQAAANQRAAEELRAAAQVIDVEARSAWRDGYDIRGEIQDGDVKLLRDRAAALASPAPAPRAEEGQANVMPEGWIDADWTHYS